MKPRISLCLASPILAALLLGASPFLHADVTMPAIFGDHMVLQQGGTLPVWGMAAAGEEVTVTAGTATAKAVIDGETVVVSSDQVTTPVAVRYGWANNPPCFLYNAADLPASPFRTDH